MTSHATSLEALELAPELAAPGPLADARIPFIEGEASVRDANAFSKSATRRLLGQAGEVGAAIWGLPFQLARWFTAIRRRRSLSQDFSDALFTLGQRMYAAEIDDGELGAKISAIDERIRQVGLAHADTLMAERKGLLVRLALAALEDDGPLPGADDEYQAAKQAQAALYKYEAGARQLESCCGSAESALAQLNPCPSK